VRSILGASPSTGSTWIGGLGLPQAEEDHPEADACQKACNYSHCHSPHRAPMSHPKGSFVMYFAT